MGDVDLVDQGLEIPRVLVQEHWNHPPQQDGDVILDILGLDHALGAIRRSRADEVTVSGLQQFDGSNLDGSVKSLMKIENRLLVFGSQGILVGSGEQSGPRGSG